MNSDTVGGLMWVSCPQAWQKRGSGSGSGVSQLGHSPFTAAAVMAATAALGTGDSKGMGRDGIALCRPAWSHQSGYAGCHRMKG